MRVVIIGGHLSPALSVIEALPKDTEIVFIGRKYTFEGDKALSLEYQTVTARGIPFRSIKTGRLQRKFTLHTVPSLGKLPYGIVQSYNILAGFKPDVVVCFGGYVQIPVALAASFLKIPIVIHEQTLKAGMANRLIAHLATKICVSWEESKRFFPKTKTILTGNPLRKEFFETLKAIPKKDKKVHRPHIFVTGGSSGSHAINVLIEGCLEQLLKKWYVIHQTGDAKFQDFDRLQELKKTLPKELQERYNLMKFVPPQEIVHTLLNADIVVSRSGMNTTTELLYLGKPCILIPLPYGQTNEQLDNARLIERTGLGKVALQNSLTPQLLYSQIAEILATLETYEVYSQKAKKLVHQDAAEKIIEVIQNTRRQKNT